MSVGGADFFIPWGGTAEAILDRRAQMRLVYKYLTREFKLAHDILALPPDGRPFTRALACNFAAAGSEAEVVVFNDADSIVPAGQIAKAVIRARETKGFVRAYSVYRRLSELYTRGMSDARQAFKGEVVWEQEHTASHGVIAMHRQTFVEMGGYDPRFVYFYDDLSLDIRAGHVPQSRIEGPLYHLWHPPREAPDSDEELWRRYEHEDPFLVRAEAGFPL